MSYTKLEWHRENATVYALEVERENVITGKSIMRNRFSALVQGYIEKEELEANARLMAAAPDLLEALQEMVQWQMDTMSGKATKGYPGTQAMNAIKKALGE